MRRFLLALIIAVASLTAWADNSVSIVYSGTTATVTVDDNIAQYLTVTQSGAHVSITQSDDLATEIIYNLSGTSTNGEFYMAGSYKATIELNGLTLTNTTPVYSGAAIHIQNGKRINVKVITGTTNTLTDAANGSQKGCIYVKGHAEFKQYGTLNVVGRTDHAIKSGDYTSIKSATINITSAVSDGISCNEYFLMESGTLNISGTGDDGIQCDLDGETSTGATVDHEDEDSGNVYISGGNITINSDAIAAKGIKCQGDAYISGDAVINVTTTGKGEWDATDQETNSACGLSSDGNINISGGTLVLTASGSGGKGMKCDNVLNISGGDITVTTTGGLYYNNGSTENINYTSNTDWVDNNYYSAPKGIKAGYKEESGNNTICYGGINISGGTIYVLTKGRNAEGIESKNYLNVTGGETTIDAYDDAINAAQDLYINDGYLYARSSNNDGIDANGNVVIEGGLIYAIGAASPEVAIDANSEENKKFHFNGGVLIAIGGLESGSTLAQTCYQTSSVSSNTWYSMTYGGNVIAFLTPTVSSGGGTNPGGGGPGGGGPGGGGSSGLVVSAPSTPTVKSGVTVSDGTPVFYGPKGYLDATVTGGSNVSLSQYSSGGGGTSGSYTVTASANPTAGGTVTGAGTYTAHSLCTLTATANAGYSFVNWTRNGSVASTAPTYSFYVTENATCVANFTQQTTSYTITAMANPANGGSVEGAGTYTSGSTATLKAVANSGYIFANWTKNGSVVSTNATYSFTVSGNATYVANFNQIITGPYITLERYTPTTALIGEDTDLSLTFKNVGTVATTGTTTVTLTSTNSNVNIEVGTLTFSALAVNATTTVSGFRFSLGTGVSLGSNVTLHYTAVNGSNTWEGDLTLTVSQIFTVTVAANNADYGTVSGGGQFNYGESCTVTATPADGYMFSNWINNGNVVSSTTEYTFNVNSNVSLVANFAEGIMIGSGTSTNEYLPSYNYYKYSLTEQIYTSSELGGAGLITSIAFYNDGTEKTRTYDFYMKATTKSSFTSKTDWIAVASSDKVFSGSVTMVAGDWTTITFSTPFVYDGTSNVVLVADDNSGAYSSSPHMACRVFTASNQALYYWDDNTNFNPLSPPTAAGSSGYGGTPNDVLSVKNQLIITKASFPTKPFNITVSVNPPQAATVTGGGEYLFGETCTLTLTPNTGYTFTGWTENGTMVSSDMSYSFIAMSDRNLVANFIQPIEIGEGTSTNTFLPSYSYYKQALSQQIYTAEEIGTSGTITCIAFYNEGSERTRTYDFYLKATTKNSFTSKTDWITMAASDKVFSGTVTMAANAWTYIIFDTPFEYDGTSNVVLVADDNTGSYVSATPHMACSVFNTSSSQALYYWDDNTNFNPLSPPTTAGSSGYSGNPNDVLSVKNHILLGFEMETAQTFTKQIDAFTVDGGYYLIASPVEEISPVDVGNMLRSSYDLYAFDEAQVEKEWRNYKAGTFDLRAGKGYLYAHNRGVNLSFTGIPYHGNGEVTLNKTGDAETAGWNLVGNPFGHRAYIDRDFYVMNAEGSGIVAAQRNYVEPMEGVFVVANEDGETLTFSTTASAKSPRLIVNLSSSSMKEVIDRAIIRFDEGGGLPKFQIKDVSTKLFIQQEGKDYAVARDNGAGEMPVFFKASENGTYMLCFIIENVEFSYLHLIDMLTGEDIDLLATPSYTFEAKTMDEANRFKVVYTIASKE